MRSVLSQYPGLFDFLFFRRCGLHLPSFAVFSLRRGLLQVPVSIVVPASECPLSCRYRPSEAVAPYLPTAVFTFCPRFSLLLLRA